MKKIYLFLVIIILLFLVTRFFKITEIPPSLYWDEASIGYNAYSIITTGHDEWGKLLPIHFRAFGEFKLPVYIYTVGLMELFFGLSEFAVRLPSVLFSLGTLIISFFLMQKIAGNKAAALMSAFLISISSWLFIFSRTGYEATAGVMFYLASLLLLVYFQKNKWFIFLSGITFIISMYSYTSFRLISPPTFVLSLFILFGFSKSNWQKYWRIITLSCIVLVFSSIPIIRLVVLDSGFGRIQSLSFLPTVRWVTGPTGKTELQVIPAPKQGQKASGNLITNYFSHFSPDFLFVSGDKNIRSQQSGFGQLYLLDLPFFLLGLIYLWGKKKRSFWFLLIPLIIAPLPASLTSEAPHALRSLTMAPFIAYISSLGIIFFLQMIKVRIILWIIIVAYLGFFSNYYYHFIQDYTIMSSKDWHLGYKKIFTDYTAQFNNYDHVVVSNQYGQPYIFALFYQKISPDFYWRNRVLNAPQDWGFSTVNRIGKYQFEKVLTQNLPTGHSLVFTTDFDKLDIKPKGVIRNLDNSIAFYVYDYQK